MLLGPVQWQIEFAQTRRGELDGLLAFEDRLDQPRAQESQADKAPDVASADAVTPGQFLKRSSAPSGQLSKPCTPARERLDQRRVTSRSVVLLRQSGQHQLGFDATPLQLDCRRQLDRAIAFA